MYPFLNAEKDQTTRNDVVINYKLNAQYGLRRGMIVTFWCVTYRFQNFIYIAILLYANARFYSFIGTLLIPRSSPSKGLLDLRATL